MKVAVTKIDTSALTLIESIKHWRRATGSDLRAAKDAIEKVYRDGSPISAHIAEDKISELRKVGFVFQDPEEGEKENTHANILFNLRLLADKALNNNHTQLAEDILHVYNQNGLT